MKRLTATAMASATGFAILLGTVGWMGSAFAGGPKNPGDAAAPAEPSPDMKAALAGGQSEIYTGIKPCRILDTRPGAPMVDAGRNFNVTGNLSGQGGSNTCGIPAYATSVAVNLTGIAVDGGGFIRGWAFNDSPATATLLNVAPAINASNQVNIPLCRGAGCTSAFTLRSYGGADLIGDAVGYYTQPLYASVGDGGGIYNGVASGVVSAVRDGLGHYVITFVRPVNACDAQATDTQFSPVREVSADVDSGAANQVVVQVRDAAGAAKDTYFDILVTC